MITFLVAYCIAMFMLFQYPQWTQGLFVLIMFIGAVFTLNFITIQWEMNKVIEEVYSFNTVEVLVNTIEAKDPYTRGHSKHVANLCLCLYDHLPTYMKKDINPHMLKYAGYLHDVGKIGIPDYILTKETNLSPEEWTVMKTHAQIGYDIVSSNIVLKSIGEWVLYHHEHVDGNGYFGLEEQDIPIEAKIISIADCYSALTTERTYHKRENHIDSISIMDIIAGKQLSRDLVDIFSLIEKEKLDACIPKEMLHDVSTILKEMIT